MAQIQVYPRGPAFLWRMPFDPPGNMEAGSGPPRTVEGAAWTCPGIRKAANMAARSKVRNRGLMFLSS
jgi:hypothetical protein